MSAAINRSAENPKPSSRVGDTERRTLIAVTPAGSLSPSRSAGRRPARQPPRRCADRLPGPRSLTIATRREARWPRRSAPGCATPPPRCAAHHRAPAFAAASRDAPAFPSSRPSLCAAPIIAHRHPHRATSSRRHRRGRAVCRPVAEQRRPAHRATPWRHHRHVSRECRPPARTDTCRPVAPHRHLPQPTRSRPRPSATAPSAASLRR